MIRPTLPVWRRGLQIGLAVLMALVPLVNALGSTLVSGNYLAVTVLGLPLGDPLAALQVLVSARGLAWTGAVGAGLALVLALAGNSNSLLTSKGEKNLAKAGFFFSP